MSRTTSQLEASEATTRNTATERHLVRDIVERKERGEVVEQHVKEYVEEKSVTTERRLRVEVENSMSEARTNIMTETETKHKDDTSEHNVAAVVRKVAIYWKNRTDYPMFVEGLTVAADLEHIDSQLNACMAKWKVRSAELIAEFKVFPLSKAQLRQYIMARLSAFSFNVPSGSRRVKAVQALCGPQVMAMTRPNHAGLNDYMFGRVQAKPGVAIDAENIQSAGIDLAIIISTDGRREDYGDIFRELCLLDLGGLDWVRRMTLSAYFEFAVMMGMMPADTHLIAVESIDRITLSGWRPLHRLGSKGYTQGTFAVSIAVAGNIYDDIVLDAIAVQALVNHQNDQKCEDRERQTRLANAAWLDASERFIQSSTDLMFKADGGLMPVTIAGQRIPERLLQRPEFVKLLIIQKESEAAEAVAVEDRINAVGPRPKRVSVFDYDYTDEKMAEYDEALRKWKIATGQAEPDCQSAPALPYAFYGAFKN